MPDITKMKINELIQYAEEQVRIERENPPPLDADATWESTLEGLRLMQERGVPKSLKE